MVQSVSFVVMRIQEKLQTCKHGEGVPRIKIPPYNGEVTGV